MPGNDLTALRALIPAPGTTNAVAKANLTQLLTDILDDIEPSVTSAQININSDLSFLSGGIYSAAADLGYAGFQDRSTDPTQVESVYVKSDELFFHDGAGNKVQLTSNGSATAGASGDITGVGYGSPVTIAWDAGTAEYRFKTGAAATDLADLVMDKARFSDGAGTEYATLGAQSGMAGVVDFSLPLAVSGGSGYLMTMDASGNMGSTATPSVATVTASGDMSADEYKITGSKTLHLQGTSWVGTNTYTYESSGVCANGTANTANICNIPLTAGDRITGFEVLGEQDLTGTLTCTLHTVDDTNVVSAAIGTPDTDASTGSPASLIQSGLTTVLASGSSYILKVTSSNVGGVVKTGNTYIAYDRP